MATTLQLFLRLPPALRCSAITPLLSRSFDCNILNGVSRRPFTNTASHLKQTRSPRAPPKPSPRQKLQLRTTPSPTKSPARPPSAHPRTSPPPPNTSPLFRDLLDSSFSERVLLYAAPSHTSFYFSSYVLGSLFLLAGTSMAYNIRRDEKSPLRKSISWKIQALTIVPAVFFVIFSTAFFIGPLKLVRTLSLVRSIPEKATVQGQMFLRFEMKHPLPFVRFPFMKRRSGGVIDAPIGNVCLDRSIDSIKENYPSYNVPLARSEDFTDKHLDPSAPLPLPGGASSSIPSSGSRGGILARLQSFNRGLLNIWPAFVRDVRRMFMRDGMMYVRIPGHGNWKMDVQDCALLDEGRPMMEVLEVDERMDKSWMGWLREKLS